jgi:hypothetical protein
MMFLNGVVILILQMNVELFYKIDDVPEFALNSATDEWQKPGFLSLVRETYGDYNGGTEWYRAGQEVLGEGIGIWEEVELNKGEYTCV